MLNVTLDESDCFSSWMVLDDVPDLRLQDRSRGLYDVICQLHFAESIYPFIRVYIKRKTRMKVAESYYNDS